MPAEVMSLFSLRFSLVRFLTRFRMEVLGKVKNGRENGESVVSYAVNARQRKLSESREMLQASAGGFTVWPGKEKERSLVRKRRERSNSGFG